MTLNNRNGKSITERPQEADERTEKRHGEIDLVVGKQGTKSAILTLVDRVTRKSLYVLVTNKTQRKVIAAIKRARKRAGGDFSEVFKMRSTTPIRTAVGSAATTKTATESFEDLCPRVWTSAS